MIQYAEAEIKYTVMDYTTLDGWKQDNHAAALAAFLNTCSDMAEPIWEVLCKPAKDKPEAKVFFELFFRPVLIEDGKIPLFTGYFEPELKGSLTETSSYRYPVYALPKEALISRPWFSRRQILETNVMNGRNLEIAWVDDPVELFFLQIQGSGRIRLPSGQTLRVGYAGANGHDYRSIGTELVKRGVYEPHQVSAQVIKNWVRRNPIKGKELLYHSPSYVFFREINDLAPERGPRGAMNRSITKMRTVAVDPKFVPLGAPVWIEKDGENPLRSLMIAQDTGSAVKGAQRADIFYGTGDVAGMAAGKLRDTGKMMVLMPIQQAYALLPDGAI